MISRNSLSVTLLLILASWGPLPEAVAGIGHVAPDRTFDVVHYRLRIAIDERAETCSGDVTITLLPLREGLDAVQLSAAELRIQRATLGTAELPFTLSGDTLLVHLGKAYGLGDTLRVNVAYSTTSTSKGLYFITADSGYPKSQSQVWSNGECQENRYWFPCYDYPNDRATSEMIVTVNDRWTAVSNGKLLSVTKDAKNHTATYHWYEAHPHVVYLVSLVAGEYTEVKDAWGTVPLSYYVYRHQRDDALRSFAKSPAIMEFFSSKTGVPYPWEKYAQTVVQDYILGGEENVSATTLTDNTIHDARSQLDWNSDGLVAHEMSHQWYGDLITCRDWSHVWLNEGFASYFDVLFHEQDAGRDAADYSMVETQRNIVATDQGASRKPTVTAQFTDPNTMFTNRIYGKGACVLHMLRYVLGDELFWKAIRHYTQKFAYGLAETNDLKVAIDEATGYNLYWFFDEWLYKAGYPEFDVTSAYDRTSGALALTVRQTQAVDSLTGLFRMPVDVEIYAGGVVLRRRIEVSKEDESFTFALTGAPDLVIFDPGSMLLKKAVVHNTTEAWIYQARHAGRAIDRLLAVRQLKDAADSAGVAEMLHAAAIADPFVEVRREAAEALGQVKRLDVTESLIAAYGDRAASVRAAAVRSLRSASSPEALSTLRHAFESDSSYNVVTSALASLRRADSVHAREYLQAALGRDSYRETIRLAALRGLADLADDTSYVTVRQFTAYGVDRNLRTEAARLLTRVWKSKPEVVPLMISFLADPSRPFRRVAVEQLGAIGDTSALGPLKRAAEGSGDRRLVTATEAAVKKIQETQLKNQKSE